MNKRQVLAALFGISLLGPLGPATAQSVIHFCGEVLPANHPAISQKWLQVLSHEAAKTAYLTALKQRAEAVFPVIEPIIAQYDIPADFKYLPLVESGGQNFTVSRRGAAGFWQLMPQTARSLGLSVLKNHDERYDLQKSTSAACRYLRELYELLGSWTLVATAYNAGPNYVQALHRRFPSAHALALPYQSAETKSYVFQAVALKELLTNPRLYPDYLSVQAMTRLSEGNPNETGDERLTMLAALRGLPDAAPVTVDSLMVVETAQSEPAPAAEPVLPAAPQLETRIVSGNPFAEGQLCLFEVVRSTIINGITVTVGDLIYAHVELLEPTARRVFLRTEKVVASQTRETTRLSLVAVETTRRPGVPVPARDALTSGWKLNWESL